ncbi:rhamnogalacturonan acetylesterase [Bacillus sp. NMCC4]|uniref:rhamnogalacturonan acetylesterase n=1 Tax=Bacillus sp. NMCC4 TaxID=2108539 RepID=UPI000D02EDAE|nr:rhamnogalacturonan acetylesterase [Bacillus sp. NMCC4]PRS38067.1 rhamnogalacturonan acetylesterase [Bacillus sp. NMCC4]
MTTIYLAGDSTVSSYPDRPVQGGWGEFLHRYTAQGVSVENRAIGGRSSKTFIEEGRLDDILADIQPGDWLFTQMGHNDASKEKPERHTDPFTTYKSYLSQYIHGARAKGATPLLLTPVGRFHEKDGEYINDFPDYCAAMKELADEEEVLLVDLNTASLQFYQISGIEKTTSYFMLSTGIEDRTHFTKEGADAIARLVSLELKDLGLTIV